MYTVFMPDIAGHGRQYASTGQVAGIDPGRKLALALSTPDQRARFPNLKPTTKSISLRLSISMLDRLKAAANKRDVPYQSLLKIWVEEKLNGLEN
jgi:CopG antitoxin of type II toxin-antitoxin system